MNLNLDLVVVSYIYFAFELADGSVLLILSCLFFLVIIIKNSIKRKFAIRCETIVKEWESEMIYDHTFSLINSHLKQYSVMKMGFESLKIIVWTAISFASCPLPVSMWWVSFSVYWNHSWHILVYDGLQQFRWMYDCKMDNEWSRDFPMPEVVVVNP